MKWAKHKKDKHFVIPHRAHESLEKTLWCPVVWQDEAERMVGHCLMAIKYCIAVDVKCLWVSVTDTKDVTLSAHSHWGLLFLGFVEKTQHSLGIVEEESCSQNGAGELAGQRRGCSRGHSPQKCTSSIQAFFSGVHCGQVCLWSYLSASFISPLSSPGLHCFVPNIAHLSLHSTAQVGWRFIKESMPSVSLIFHIDFQLSSSLIVALLLSVALEKRT